MSLMPSIDENERYAQMFDIVKRYVQNQNPTKIARDLGLRRVDVLKYIEEWKNSAVHSDMMKDRVDELISVMDEHFGILIQKSYEVIEEVDAPQDENRKATMTRSQMLSQKMNAIKTIADLEAKRIDILQKSGLLEAADLGDELVEMEDRQRELIRIISEELCTSCKPKVMGRIHSVMNGHSSAPVVVESEVVDGVIVNE